MADATPNNTNRLSTVVDNAADVATPSALDHHDSDPENNRNEPSTIPKKKKRSALKEDIVNFYFVFKSS